MQYIRLTTLYDTPFHLKQEKVNFTPIRLNGKVVLIKELDLNDKDCFLIIKEKNSLLKQFKSGKKEDEKEVPIRLYVANDIVLMKPYEIGISSNQKTI
jgi:hypothetical protein